MFKNVYYRHNIFNIFSLVERWQKHSLVYCTQKILELTAIQIWTLFNIKLWWLKTTTGWEKMVIMTSHQRKIFKVTLSLIIRTVIFCLQKNGIYFLMDWAYKLVWSYLYCKHTGQHILNKLQSVIIFIYFNIFLQNNNYV